MLPNEIEKHVNPFVQRDPQNDPKGGTKWVDPGRDPNNDTWVVVVYKDATLVIGCAR